jgi:hypothetical protein
LRAAVIDAVLRRAGESDDGAVFERARRVGFAGVEVALRRDDLLSGDRCRVAARERRDRARDHVADPRLAQRRGWDRRRRCRRRGARGRRRACRGRGGDRARRRRHPRPLLPARRDPRRRRLRALRRCVPGRSAPLRRRPASRSATRGCCRPERCGGSRSARRHPRSASITESWARATCGLTHRSSCRTRRNALDA